MKERNSKVGLIAVAWRNLSRYKVKTALTLVAVIFGVTMFIFIDGLMMGLNVDSERNIINYETGALKIYSKAFFEKRDEIPMYETFTGYEALQEKLEGLGFDSAARVKFGGSLISREQEVPFMFAGVDIARENTVLHYDEFIEDGAFPRSGQFEVLLGARGAKNLSVAVGDHVRLSTVIDKKDSNGKIRHINQVIDLKVAGIMNTPNPLLNGMFAVLPMDILQDELGLLLEGDVTEIVIRGKGENLAMVPDAYAQKEQIVSMFAGTLPDNLIVTTWEEDAIDFLTITRSKSSATGLIVFFIFILAGMGISNTMMMAVMERTKELGMMRSMGMTDAQVVRAFMYEGGLIGFTGSIIGVVLGVLINLYMVNIGIDFTKMLESFEGEYGYRVVGVFKSTWVYSTIVFSGVIATVISAVAAYFPARRGVKMAITDALRFE